MEPLARPQQELLADLSGDEREIAALCSVPHWVDDDLAYGLAHRFAQLNGDAESAVARIKSLPIVYPYETRGWQFAPQVRTYLDQKLCTEVVRYERLCRYLVAEFDHQMLGASKRSILGRELQWRAAFHMAPPDAEESLDRLDNVVDWAEDSQLSDLKAAVDLCDEQKRWLTTLEPDTAFFRGRYAYGRGDFATAERFLKIAWELSRSRWRRAIAGHLLGAIWRRQGGRTNLIRAERILRDALDLARDLQHSYGQVHIYNTLATTLGDLGTKSRLEEAESLAQYSLEIAERHGFTRSIAYSSIILASILLTLRPGNWLTEIRRLLEGAKAIGDENLWVDVRSTALNIEARMWTTVGDFKKAAAALEEAVELDPDNAEFRKFLGHVLIELGESRLPEAKTELCRARELGLQDEEIDSQLRRIERMQNAVEKREAGKTRTKTARGTYDLGKAYEKESNDALAEKCYWNAIRRGYDRPIAKFRLGRLLAKKDNTRPEAVRLLREAVEDGLRDHPTLATLARSLHKLADFGDKPSLHTEAKKIFQEALEKDKGRVNASLRNWYGQFLLECEGAYSNAYSFLKEASEMMPSSAAFANDVGRVILKAKWRDKYEEARMYLERSIALSDEEFIWPRRFLELLDQLESKGRELDL